MYSDRYDTRDYERFVGEEQCHDPFVVDDDEWEREKEERRERAAKCEEANRERRSRCGGT